MTSTGARALTGAKITIVGQLTRFAVQFAGLAILARLLNPVDYGRLAMVLTVTGLAGILADFGLSLATVQRPQTTEAARATIFWCNVAAGALLAGLLTLAAPAVASFYGGADIVPLIDLIAVTFLLSGALGQYRAEAMRRGKFGALAASDVLAQLAGLVVALVAYSAGAGYWSLACQQVAAAAFTLIILVVSTRWNPLQMINLREVRPFIADGSTNALTQAFNFASSNADNAAIGHSLGSTVLGVYSRAYQLLTIPTQQLLAPLTRVALPMLVAAGDTAERQSYLSRTQLLMGYVPLQLMAIVGAASPSVVHILYGDDWSAAASLLSVLCVGGAFQVAGYVYYWIALAEREVRTFLILEASVRVVTIFAIIVASQYSPLWVAGAVSGGSALTWILMTAVALPRFGYSRRLLISPLLRPAALAITLTLSMAILSLTNPQLAGGWLGLLVALSLAACLLLVSQLHAGYRSDLKVLIRITRTALGFGRVFTEPTVEPLASRARHG